MNRYSDWPERLQRFVNDCERKDAEWGVHNCALFAADAVIAMTGVDLAADFRGQYSTAHGALRVMKAFAGNLPDVAEKIADQNHIAAVPVALAQRGDVAIVSYDGTLFKHAMALVMIGHLLIPTRPRGLERVSLSRMTKVWAVGREI